MSNLETGKNGSAANGGQLQSLAHQQLSASSALQQFSHSLSPSNAMTALDHYRLSQLYQYALAADRLRCPPPTSSSTTSATNHSVVSQFQHNSPLNIFRPDMAAAAAAAAVPLLYNNPYYRLDPRLALYRPPEEPKPQHSYIGLIAMAILTSPEKKLVLSDIYQHILDNYAYFRSRGPGWRNSIRHNLSLNDCFVKAGRSANGKGHYWAIHPANLEDFQKGDFRRRKAQRKVRRHMGLAVDDEDSPSPPPNSPPPLALLRPTADMLNWQEHHPNFLRHSIPHNLGLANIGLSHFASPQNEIPFYANSPAAFNKYVANNNDISSNSMARGLPELSRNVNTNSTTVKSLGRNRNKRQFDVASLLAPEMKEALLQHSPSSSGNDERFESENIDNCSSSPLEKSYDNKLSSSSSSLFQVHSDEDEQGDGVSTGKSLRNEDGGINEQIERLDGSSRTPPSRSRSPSPNVVVVDNEDLIIGNCANASGKSSLERHHQSIGHGRRFLQRRQFRARRTTTAAAAAAGTCDNINNNKEQLPANARHAISSSPENNSRGYPFNTDLMLSTGQAQGPSSRQYDSNSEIFFQQNPSLAHLVILSSRYRELTSTLQQQQQPNSKKM